MPLSSYAPPADWYTYTPEQAGAFAAGKSKEEIWKLIGYERGTRNRHAVVAALKAALSQEQAAPAAPVTP